MSTSGTRFTAHRSPARQWNVTRDQMQERAKCSGRCGPTCCSHAHDCRYPRRNVPPVEVQGGARRQLDEGADPAWRQGSLKTERRKVGAPCHCRLSDPSARALWPSTMPSSTTLLFPDINVWVALTYEGTGRFLPCRIRQSRTADAGHVRSGTAGTGEVSDPARASVERTAPVGRLERHQAHGPLREKLPGLGAGERQAQGY